MIGILSRLLNDIILSIACDVDSLHAAMVLLLEQLVIVRLHFVATLADQLLDGGHVFRTCHIGHQVISLRG